MMKSRGLTAIGLSAAITFGGAACTGGEDTPKHDIAGSLKPTPELQAEFRDAKLKFESSVREGSFSGVAFLGTCAIVGSEKTGTSHVVPNPIFITAGPERNNLSTVGGYDSEHNQFVYGSTIFLSNKNTVSGAQTLPGEVQEKMIPEDSEIIIFKTDIEYKDSKLVSALQGVEVANASGPFEGSVDEVASLDAARQACEAGLQSGVTDVPPTMPQPDLAA